MALIRYFILGAAGCLAHEVSSVDVRLMVHEPTMGGVAGMDRVTDMCVVLGVTRAASTGVASLLTHVLATVE